MREAIRGHQRQSKGSHVLAAHSKERLMREAIRGHQRQSKGSHVLAAHL